MATQSKQAQVFRYERPSLERGKGVVRLCKTDILKGDVQVVTRGGENNLHSHSGNDGFWMVLGGRFRFYGEGDVVLAELGAHEGILIPRGFKYWFESVGNEPGEILHVAALAQHTRDERSDYTPIKEGQINVPVFEGARR